MGVVGHLGQLTLLKGLVAFCTVLLGPRPFASLLQSKVSSKGQYQLALARRDPALVAGRCAELDRKAGLLQQAHRPCFSRHRLFQQLDGCAELDHGPAGVDGMSPAQFSPLFGGVSGP